ncbi:MAG: hypothetical protein CMF12_06030 [Idiomarina sp.]|uniref:hypothetical protein n=1 Tax=Idiomarina sp. TaxID=1874361 RepID=UPI000C6962AB|nr:hypothetical protein [Idiomarina sp.]MBT42065.1 hypothetical protein [Idiomarina sp.]|tara:strand:- start:51 stop:1007 length:957 start_codon:yes stop_codon:yes gene_type:complete
MRLFWGLLSLLLSFSVISQEYTVTVPINDQPDNVVRNAARVKVQWEAALNYPVLISGNEYTNEMDEYRAEIAAMTVGAVNVQTVSEQWLRSQNMLRYTATTSLNEAVTMAAFDNLRSSMSLQKELSAAYAKMNALIAEKTIDADQFLLNAKKAAAASKVFFVQDTLESTLKAKAALRQYFVRLIIYDYYLPFIESLKFKLTDAGPGYVSYEVTSDWYDTLTGACRKVIPFYDDPLSPKGRYKYYEQCIESNFLEHASVFHSAIDAVRLHAPFDTSKTQIANGISTFHLRLEDLPAESVENYLQEPERIKDAFYVFFKH